MTPADRTLLGQLGYSPEAVAKTVAVLEAWGDPPLFAECATCREACFHPDLPKGKHLRLKLPAELWLRRDLLGFRERHDDPTSPVICWACDEIAFQ